MSLPGFTAETSLYRTTNRYQMISISGAPAVGTEVLPQQVPPCTVTSGDCTTVVGSPSCVVSPISGQVQCCGQGLFWGYYPYIRECSDGYIEEGCGICYF